MENLNHNLNQIIFFQSTQRIQNWNENFKRFHRSGINFVFEQIRGNIPCNIYASYGTFHKTGNFCS